jgi:copper(I)-binding protein
VKAPRRIGIALVAVAMTLLSAGCAAGQHAATAQESAAIDGAVGSSVGSIDVRGIAIQAPATGTSYAVSSSATVTGVIVNTGHADDTLTNVTAKYGTGSTAGSAGGWAVYPNQQDAIAAVSNPQGSSGATGASTAPLTIPAGTSVGFALPSSPQVLELTGLTSKLWTAQTVTLTLTFAKAGSVTIAVPVQLSNTPGTSTVPAVPSDSAE